MGKIATKLTVLLASVVLAVGSAACSRRPTSPPSAVETTANNADLPDTQSVEGEAVDKVKEYFSDKYLVTCGDSYYSRSRDEDSMDPPHTVRTYEFRDGVFVLKKINPLTQADRLNGVEWDGTVKFEFTAKRFHRDNRGWSDWTTPDPRALIWTARATKKNGQWNIQPEILTRYSKPDCSDIPQ